MGWSINYRPTPIDPTSQLGAAAASLSPGQWAPFAMSGLLNSVWIANNNTYLDGCPIGQYDPFNDRLVFMGGEHPTGPSTHAQINGPLSTNTFSRDSVEPANIADSSLPQPEHGYYHMAVDTSTGDIYWISSVQYPGIDFKTVHRRVGGTAAAWTDIGLTPIQRSPSSGAGLAMAQAWHPGMFGGRGGLVQVGAGAIAIYNPLTGLWTSPVAKSMGTINNVAVYSRADQCIYCGGGNNNLSMYKVDVNGVITQLANFPFAVGSNFNSTQGPLFASTGTNRIVVMSVAQQAIGKVIYEYNPGADSWAQIDTYPFTYGAGYAAFTVDSCGVLLFVYNVSSTTINPSAYIWKR